ncbi:MAG TPA: bifunctional diaminohydroxyphosphoribosylaminopyrimidine deaminase/5-amino-6-(5-phosphoribosylamino)uracil reductase RibD [Syntrophorhabdus sp.]|nr:bifunctional diaminohydroxyphosphoribosylaminopyrimidine deaminase/5-amino-6-(5-phosphoribosylamino)uracil reductase RibD [Syntrophorhabdus sp.]HPB37479.1 bifunctional diaminohydroxyphosphoribosylaminopyrimidine deaminase/5-amino-6-(5-phosphoribosylamino)uracil reductase RibD [Syntrophorhabdus sp.]HQB33923.1 bifunctional diaminohydroxyphosphoribosylaminopyrimidine deaminase/5-amino-6-(5-phosphoribosylamino)uracil reductase RibD [Syntrophorhabdus sp.]
MKDEQCMHLALSLARKGMGMTSPNPMVGALLVRGNRIVGKGYHRKAGTPHAEIVALNEAKEEAKGATLYVNLEPCAHAGRTPPCVNSIIAAGVRRVVVAMLDPNPLVNGEGVNELKKAGIEVKVGLLEEEAKRLNEAFAVYMEKKRPFFTMKGAVSLDGKIATKTCDSKWISNEESRRFVNKVRATVDGIMVGINTVILDNPLLVPKIARPRKYPVRIVLDSKLRIPLSCDLVKTSEKYKTWIFTSEDSRPDKEVKLRAMGLDVIRVSKDESGRVSPKHVCEVLYQREIMHVLVEGGGEINSCLLKEGFLDKIMLFYAPILIGGKGAYNLIGGKGIDFLKDAYKINIAAVKRFKEDIYVEGYVHRNY